MGLLNSLHLNLSLLVTTAVATAAAEAQPNPVCNYTCGNVSIPYPFGTNKNCYRDEKFFLNCTTATSPSSSGEAATQLIHGNNIPVLNISLDPPELTVSANVSYHCYDSRHSYNSIQFGKFSISNTKNRFTVVGCDTIALITALDDTFRTGCVSSCSKETRFEEGACSGVGCCQSSLPQAIRSRYNITLKCFDHKDEPNFNPCGYAFIAKEGSFNFSHRDLHDLRNRTQFPVVVDWAVSNQTCVEAKKDTRSYACKQNSRCQNSNGTTGYYCICEQGFGGNPYLSDPDTGCKDINECEGKNRCTWRCHDVDGNYTCSCPWGYKGDGYKDRSSCKFPIKEISLGILVGLLVIFTLVSTLCWGNKKRALKQLRIQYFEQNGGNFMLQRLHRLHQQGYTDRTKIFTKDELKIATNNFDETRILGHGGQGTVYKGILPNNSLDAIKKSRVGGDPRQVKDFINEVTVLSQINHRNVVKLFGYCLETEVPLLV